MKIRHLIRRTALCVALGIALPQAALALGTEFTWQGELRDAGVPANGSYDIEMRLFAAATGGTPLGTTYIMTGQPISNGVFTAVLNFGDQFTGEPRWLEIRVRRAGEMVYTPLVPRQSVTAAPYALHAEFVADNSIVSANIADRSITGTDLQLNTITSFEIADSTIRSTDLSDNSVNSAKIADNSIARVDMGPGSVGTSELVDASVTAAKLAAGAIGAAQVNTNQIQQRITTRCPSELPMIGVKQDGSPVCGSVSYLLPGDSAVTPKIALRSDDRPVVLFVDDVANDLKLASCGDTACASATVETLDSEVGDPGGSLDVVVRSTNLPFVAYYDEPVTDLHAFDCDNSLCSNATFRSLDNLGSTGTAVSLALRPGNLPIVSYRYDTSVDILVYDCNNTGCSTGDRRAVVTAEVSAASDTAVATSTLGLPVVFYEGSGSREGLNSYVCTNNDCSAGASFDLDNGDVTSIAAAMNTLNVPTVVHRVNSGGADSVRVLSCAGGFGLCQSGTITNVEFDTPDTTVDIAMAADNTPLLAYLVDDRLAVQDCGSTDCVTRTLRTPDATAGRGGNPSMALRSDGRLVIAYEDNGRVRITICGDLGCAP